MPTSSSHLPDQPIMKYVHPADRLRPWLGVAVGLAALALMLAFAILGRDFGTLKHLQALNDAGAWLTISLIEASAGILALLLAAVALGHRAGRLLRGAKGHHHLRGRGRVGDHGPGRGADSAVSRDDRGVCVHALVFVGDAYGDVRGASRERPGGGSSGGKYRRALLVPRARPSRTPFLSANFSERG
jgi:hypothetical protein